MELYLYVNSSDFENYLSFNFIFPLKAPLDNIFYSSFCAIKNKCLFLSVNRIDKEIVYRETANGYIFPFEICISMDDMLACRIIDDEYHCRDGYIKDIRDGDIGCFLDYAIPTYKVKTIYAYGEKVAYQAYENFDFPRELLINNGPEKTIKIEVELIKKANQESLFNFNLYQKIVSAYFSVLKFYQNKDYKSQRIAYNFDNAFFEVFNNNRNISFEYVMNKLNNGLIPPEKCEKTKTKTYYAYFIRKLVENIVLKYETKYFEEITSINENEKCCLSMIALLIDSALNSSKYDKSITLQTHFIEAMEYLEKKYIKLSKPEEVVAETYSNFINHYTGLNFEGYIARFNANPRKQLYTPLIIALFLKDNFGCRFDDFCYRVENASMSEEERLMTIFINGLIQDSSYVPAKYKNDFVEWNMACKIIESVFSTDSNQVTPNNKAEDLYCYDYELKIYDNRSISERAKASLDKWINEKLDSHTQNNISKLHQMMRVKDKKINTKDEKELERIFKELFISAPSKKRKNKKKVSNVEQISLIDEDNIEGE